VKFEQREQGREGMKIAKLRLIEAKAQQVEVLKRREQLLAFGMATLPRLGGKAGTGAEEEGLEEANGGCPFRDMDDDVFKMIGDALVCEEGVATAKTILESRSQLA
jgi:hypothetical protein